MKSRAYFFGQLALILISVLPLIQINPEVFNKSIEISVDHGGYEQELVAITFSDEEIRTNP
ncbi:MAG: hypothetical protein DWQ02_26650 [Bacteroidetes bacterium]|nr:MAG: hypothetical protein DWQ02_26650 [Bacteroidota bacterium]